MSIKTELFGSISKLTSMHGVLGFTLVFLSVLTLVNLMLLTAAAFSRKIYGDSFEENYSRFGLALLPLTVASFMAFHLYYFVHLGVQLPILVSHNFDFEFLRTLIIKVPEQATLVVQEALIWVGLSWSLFIMSQLARASHRGAAREIIGAIPHAILALILALFMQSTMTSYFHS
jgi:hypothetical protein